MMGTIAKQCVLASLAAGGFMLDAQGAWVANLSSQQGPVAMVELPAPRGETRLAIFAFEYSRKCDPLFTYAVVRGRKFGTPEKQSLLPQSNIGGTINRKRYSGNNAAVVTTYSNGFEVGFGMPDEMAMAIAFDKVGSVSFITPKGDEVLLPIDGLRTAVDKAIEACVSKIQP